MELKHIQEEILQDLAFKPASEWAEAERLHMDTCPDCQESLEAYQLVFAELGDQADPMFSASFEAGIMDQIPELSSGSELAEAPVTELLPEASERTPWWQWGGIAAAVAAGIGVFIYTFLPVGQTPALDSLSERMGSVGDNLSEGFSFVEGNEILIAAGIVSFASIFLLDKLLSRRQEKDTIPE